MSDVRERDKTIAAARYLGVAPWELEQHPEWRERALVLVEREQSAQRRLVRNTQRGVDVRVTAGTGTADPHRIATQIHEALLPLLKGGD